MFVKVFDIVLDSCLRPPSIVLFRRTCRNDVVNGFWDFADTEFVTSSGSEKSEEPESTNNIFSSLRQLADRHDKNERIRVNPEICEIQNSSKALICMHISKIVFRKKRSIARYRLVIRIVQ